jgi:pyruvate, water dikinase
MNTASSFAAQIKADAPARNFIRFFSEIGIADVPLVGGKNASLGEMYRELTSAGILVPNGFAITAEAYRYALDSAGAWAPLRAALNGLDPDDVSDLARRAAQAREIICGAKLPSDLEDQICQSVERLKAEYGADLTVAVRSSATAEDLPSASFAGQHESYLNIAGDAVVEATRRCFASLFTDRAIRYRIDNGFDHFKVFNSVGVMKMVRSDLAASGVIFTIDTESGFEDAVFITGAFGLGENVVQGAVDPDEFYVFKPTYRTGKKAVLKRSRGSKQIKMIFSDGESATTTCNVSTEPEERERFCLSDAEVLALAGQAMQIETHYSAKAGAARPMDIEWAKDGVDGRLYIVQARPETVASRRDHNIVEDYVIEARGPKIIEGRAVGTKIATGKARVIENLSELSQFVPGEILIADSTSPDWGTVMKAAAAIVTNRGGRTCHAAIVARELGIPAIVGAGSATRAIQTGQIISVCCAEGDVGAVYEGEISFTVEKTNIAQLQRPSTHIMMNVGNPDAAFSLAALPNDGVGLARMEFIIAESIKAHPMALVHPERIADESERAQILALTRNYASPSQFFVERLSEGVATIAAAFYPKPVVVRMSDFKTNEYASLLGGRAFEVNEVNPMIGFRGASRYAHPAYGEGFALECAAMKRAREEMGFENIRLMIPFCRRVEEAERVVERMRSLGLERGKNGLELYMMCEIPNNVMLIDEFSKYFDGFSIGSNDLTQLTLGVDRDSEIVAFDFDERDEGVKKMIALAIEGARRNNRHSGICGQAPSDYPEIAEFLVRLGIDSISLNPDTVIRTTTRVVELERSLGRLPPSSRGA